MNILKEPPTRQQLQFGLSLTGITYLKERQYRRRHIGKGNSYISGKGDIITTTAARIEEKILSPILKNTHKKTGSSPQATGISNERTGIKDTKKIYRIKKSLVKHRLLNLINALPKTQPLHFVTVTFPNTISDEIAYKVFNTWLTRCRKAKLISSYLWIAERQKIGTIHFHIAIPDYFKVWLANRYMQQCLTTQVRKQQLNWNIQAAKRYNGVDLAKIKGTNRVNNFNCRKGKKSLSNYLTKYITKNNTEFNRLAWHNSRDFGVVITKVTCTKAELLSSGMLAELDTTKPFISNYIIFYKWKTSPPNQLKEYLSQLNSTLLAQLHNDNQLKSALQN